MSIKVRLASDAPEERSKIRVTLDGQPLTPLQLPPLAPKAPEPLPARVATFWFFDEDAHRASRPWRDAESSWKATARGRGYNKEDVAGGVAPHPSERALYLPRRRTAHRPGCHRGGAGVGVTEFSGVWAYYPRCGF